MNNINLQNEEFKKYQNREIENPKRKLKKYKEKLSLDDFAELFINDNQKNISKEEKFILSLNKNRQFIELNDNDFSERSNLDINLYKNIRKKIQNSPLKKDNFKEIIKKKDRTNKIYAPPFSLRTKFSNSENNKNILEDIKNENIINEINMQIIPEERNIQKSKKRKEKLYKLFEKKN